MVKKIIFRADGNSVSGLGHLYRLFSLVEIVKGKLDFLYLTKESSQLSAIPEEYNKGFIPENINIQGEPKWLAEHFDPKGHIVIADGYQFTSSYQKDIKEKGFDLIYIDDLAHEHMYADVVINHSPYFQERHFKKEPYTKLALGTKFALLRPSFLNAAKRGRKISKIDAAFICFGGADPFNLSLLAVKALLKIQTIKKINVVLGAAYKHDAIAHLEKDHPEKIKIYRNLSEQKLLKVMYGCNLAIAPASTIIYELCCVMMPILGGYYVENQEFIYLGFLENKAIFKGGNFKNFKEDGFLKILEIIIDRHNFKEQLEAQKTLFDSKISSRHFNLINELC